MITVHVPWPVIDTPAPFVDADTLRMVRTTANGFGAPFDLIVDDSPDREDDAPIRSEPEPETGTLMTLFLDGYVPREMPTLPYAVRLATDLAFMLGGRMEGVPEWEPDRVY